MNFDVDTYIVLGLPTDVAREVLSLRRHLNHFYETIPAEITIAGSSGVGTVSQDQDSQEFVEMLERIAAVTPPIEMKFKGVGSFPNSGVFFLEPSDQSPFRSLHQRLVNSGLKFRFSPFPYFAHCSIMNDSTMSVRNREAILTLDFPKSVFTLRDLRVYSLAGADCRLLHETMLSGGRNSTRDEG